jgi:hypothetical protein
LSAAFIIAASNFANEPNVLVYLAATGLLGMVVILPTAAEFGRHSETAPSQKPPPDWLIRAFLISRDFGRHRFRMGYGTIGLGHALILKRFREDSIPEKTQFPVLWDNPLRCLKKVLGC